MSRGPWHVCRSLEKLDKNYVKCRAQELELHFHTNKPSGSRCVLELKLPTFRGNGNVNGKPTIVEREVIFQFYYRTSARTIDGH